MDCEDFSDELGCQTAIINKNNYLKDRPPKNAVVRIKIELLEILEIDEVKMQFKNQFKLYMKWLDSRLTFHNLHEQQSLNKLVDEEKNEIWTPSLIFENTDEKIHTKVDKKSEISVRKEGNFSKMDIDNVDNVFLYHGGENPLMMNRVFHTKW